MARATKQLSGGGKDKLICDMIASEPSIAVDAAARLSDSMCNAIKNMRVDTEVWEQHRLAREAAKTAAAPLATDAAPVSAPTAFDPFAFSALAILTKKGAAELATRLAAIGSAANLHALAKAQHLAIDPKITDLAALRTAVMTATESRLAERRAAAS